MRFEFVIEIVPDEKEGIRVPACTEGALRVLIGDRLFLEADGVLLVEFAIALQEWLGELEREGVLDLHYASMDFEEEPISALLYDPAIERFQPEAVWATGAAVPISVDDAKSAASSFVWRLGSELAEDHSIDLDAVLVANCRAPSELSRARQQ